MPEWDENDPVSRPWEVTEEIWQAMPPGVRVRTLRAQEEQFQLSAEHYRELSRLPFWMFYGPEHGIPDDWFNERGLLLPKFRPGGGRYQEFRRWRHAYRTFRWRRRLAARQLSPILQMIVALFCIVGCASLFVAVIAPGNLFESFLSPQAYALLLLASAASILLAGFLLMHLVVRVYFLAVDRRTADRLAEAAVDEPRAG